MADVPVITIDGPSGSGKGAVSSALSQALNWHVLDSGAIYRGLALAARKQGVDLADEAALSELAGRLDIHFRQNNAGTGIAVFLGQEEVSAPIREESCGNAASQIAPYKGVRRALLERQRSFQRPPGLIADGRDMGTVVFPDAPVKIFLQASPEERVNRRYKQLKEQGFSVTLAGLSAEIAERDVRDKGRAQSPLKPASDAVVIDTTDMDIKQVVVQVLELAKTAFPELSDQLSIN
jgi:cytidylate kinase